MDGRLRRCVLLAAVAGCGPSLATESGVSGTTGELSRTVSTGAASGPSDTTARPSGSSSSSSSSGGPVPVDLPDECSTYAQDCPPGYKCTNTSTQGLLTPDGATCVPVVPNPVGPGEVCTIEGSVGLDDCDAGSMCWFFDPETLQGICHAFCIGTQREPDCANPCDSCAITGDHLLNICLSACDPLAPDCPESLPCRLTPERFECSWSLGSFDAPLGSTCDAQDVCAFGLVCMATEILPDCMGTPGCCTPLCRTDDDDPCPTLVPGTTCEPVFGGFDGLPPGCPGSGIGTCVAR